MNRKKTLGWFLIKNYIMFSFVLIVIVTVIYNLVFSFARSINNQILNKAIFAENIVRSDYKNIDINNLKDISGWIEILDRNNKVIYTKGKVLEKKSYYTRDELLQQSIFSKESIDDSIHVLGFYIGNATYDQKKRYVASYKSFVGDNGEKYVCIVKIPVEKIKFNYILYNATGDTFEIGVTYIIIILLSITIVFLACVYWYSRNIQKHITKPNKTLVECLKTITSGNYAKRLNLNAEYEYREIEDSFNFMAAELGEASKQRHKYEQERQQMLSSIVHDLKTPITSIRGYAKALLEGMVKEPKKHQEYLTTIYSKTEHMNKLAELLSTYAKMDSSSYKLKLEKVDFAEFVRKIIADCFDELEKKNINLEVHIPEQVIELSIDKVEMKRAIENLITNAAKHNPENTTVKICLYKNDKSYVALEIIDNGTAIPESLAQKMFEPFICGDESRTTKNGSGLGLSICKKIAEKHNGKIEYEYSVDGWKCFRIILKSTIQ
ncbi:HAMP domain-containing sensor histidine kinase [Clostridium oryzae]|uniref:histidine kinase n=1 Tax=Clostridium oryzae TaxID=1450648 RepID=A0A1V4ICE6_9CLOT|nr:HAMP domain-containing sensor histidine kinase [Clostridium oryzae]OPJ57599.1 sensor protein kinase WalK [Clostridium oryzae]